MLSECSSCKFFNPELCAVNPLYRQRADRWRGRLSEQDLADLSFLGAELHDCLDWQRSEELEPVMVELTLTRRQWQQVSQALARAGLLALLAEQLQGVISAPEDVRMVPVESSNIAAIGYGIQEETLWVDFHSGSRYRYLDVPIWVFEDFLEARSKGQFLNSRIKGEYDYERLTNWLG